ncbi:heavy metal-associated isoprenylated plant protein 7-like [Zingiber officinale]|uniref:heavy metal-associated isoprenylated plant protein 7-like n=1 Tax=Zingiber officinale TaxID=94328 RepID=UPI001C4BEFB4|nr:heavy metal-associated isoprenylated plant protein 7-like [Zingiber officinale]
MPPPACTYAYEKENDSRYASFIAYVHALVNVAKGGESGNDGGKKEEADEKPPTPPPPSPPPQSQEEVVMRVYMDCAGCARKVRQSLRGFPGVEEVVVNSWTHRVVVKGRKAAEDPLKVVARVQKKSGKKVDLLSPLPTPPTPPEKKEEDQKPIGEEMQPQVIVAVLRVYMHCEACAQEIKKRILRMKGVRSTEPNLKASEVTVKGVFHPEILAAYVLKRTGKHATVVKQEPEEKPVEDPEKSKAKEPPPPTAAGDDAKDEKNPEGREQVDKEDEDCGSRNEGEQSEKKADGDADTKEKEKKTDPKKEENKVEEVVVVDIGATSTPPPPPSADGEGAGGARKILIKNENYYYYPKYPAEFYAYPPQIFSDENPNACVVM